MGQLCEIRYNMKQCTVCSILRTRIPSYRSTFAGFAVCPSIRSPFCRFALLSYLVLPCPPEPSCPCAIFSYVWLRAYIHASAQACVCMQCVWCGVCRAGACVYIHVILWKWPRLCVSNQNHGNMCTCAWMSIRTHSFCSVSMFWVCLYVCMHWFHAFLHLTLLTEFSDFCFSGR